MLALDVRAWSVWALTGMVVATLMANPFYGLLVLLIALMVDASSQERRSGPLLVSPLRFAIVVVGLATAFNVLSVRVGNTVMLWIPESIPLLSGPLTAEAAVFGATNGIKLAAIFAVFAAFNGATAAHDVIRLAPRAFHNVGVVVSIALTFIPQTTSSLVRIREAQTLRGHRLRGLRDWLPIVVPLVVQGLERSMGLAEAMVARGFGSVANRRHSPRLQGMIASGLLALLVGWLILLFLPAWIVLGTGSMLLGIGLIAGALCLAGRTFPHTSYRERHWKVSDTLVIIGCSCAAAVAVLPIPVLDRTTLAYSPYPMLSLPGFDLGIGFGLVGLLVPALLSELRRNVQTDLNHAGASREEVYASPGQEAA